MLVYIRSRFQAHAFHLVSPSPWPVLSSTTLLAIAFAAILVMHSSFKMYFFPRLSFFCLLCVMSYWFRDIIIEATYLGNHTLAVKRGLFIGFALFIISEALFFIAIFWTYFHSSLSPTVILGSQWPPAGIMAINPFEFPLFNTLILLSSGFAVTRAHHSLILGGRNGRKNFLMGLFFTVFLGFFFTGFQNLEYSESPFTISDGVFGSCFFFGTGFHGFHVLVGTVLLLASGLRGVLYHVTRTHHMGLESSVMYWHFVDVIWIFLYLAIYYWGS